jgi:superfamily I DNA/RNA helicase
MAESKAGRDQLMATLRAAGYAVEAIEADTRVSAEAKSLLCATMHRAKGLEFQNVIVTCPTAHQGNSAAVAPQLLYVALTRARQRAALLTAV